MLITEDPQQGGGFIDGYVEVLTVERVEAAHAAAEGHNPCGQTLAPPRTLPSFVGCGRLTGAAIAAASVVSSAERSGKSRSSSHRAGSETA
jgi:hypothetical protein